MILHGHPVLHSAIGYQFHFGLDTRGHRGLENYCAKRSPFCDIALGCYHACTDTVRTCHHEAEHQVLDPSIQGGSKYIPYYQKNVRRRIRPLFRQLRDALVIELKPISVSGISLGQEAPIAGQSSVSLRALVALQTIGIGALSVMIEGLMPTKEDEWLQLRDPSLVTLDFQTGSLSRQRWPLLQFVRYLVLLSHAGFARKPIRAQEFESSPSLRTDRELNTLLRKRFARTARRETSVCVEIDNYPFFFIHFDLPTSVLREEFAKFPSEIRLALCGDRNWKCKSQSTVTSSVLDADTSSRDSILWLANSEGTVKLLSNQLETNFIESVTATLLETDIILTMRYLLQGMNSLMMRLSEKTLKPADFSRLRHDLFSNLDKYCNIEVSHKDTTRIRIEALKSILRIDSMYKGVVDRSDLLGNRMSARNALGIERQQILLTLVFGFFGALNVLSRVFSNIAVLTSRGWYVPYVASLLCSLAIALSLWLVAKAVRRRA